MMPSIPQIAPKTPYRGCLCSRWPIGPRGLAELHVGGPLGRGPIPPYWPVLAGATVVAPRSAGACPRRCAAADRPSCAGGCHARSPSRGFHSTTSGRSLRLPEELAPTWLVSERRKKVQPRHRPCAGASGIVWHCAVRAPVIVPHGKLPAARATPPDYPGRPWFQVTNPHRA